MADKIAIEPEAQAASWREDLERSVELDPSHVSAYALSPEAGTPIHAALERGDLRMPADDETAEFYDTARRILSAAGIGQYEISNFARPGHRCRQNDIYWSCREYFAAASRSTTCASSSRGV